MLNLYKIKNEESRKADYKASDKNPRSDFTKYVDAEESLTAKELMAGLWFAKHRVLLYRCLVVFLLMFLTVFWAFSLYHWGVYLWAIPQQRLLEKDLSNSIDYSILNASIAALPPQIVGAQVFNSGVNKYDAVAEVVNPNEKFLVSFDYYFQFDEEKTDTAKTTLLPSQNRPVYISGIESGASPGRPNLIIQNTSWKRINTHDIKDAKTWQEEHLDFKVSDFSFTRNTGLTSTLADANVIKFKITNQSPYSYRAPSFEVGLYYGGFFVGVLPLQFDTPFYSLATKEVDLRSFSTSLSADKAVVFPLINVFDKDIYVELPKN